MKKKCNHKWRILDKKSGILFDFVLLACDKCGETKKENI